MVETLMNYNPREYWANRLKREGSLYVSTKNNSKVNDHQLRVFRDAIQYIAPADIGDILDFGCGVGRFSDTFEDKFNSYTGVDINEGAFEYAPKRENKSFVHLAEDVIPFGDNSFDGAMAITVLQHIVDEEQFTNWANELHRVVKPGGYFLIIDDAETSKKLASHMKVRGSAAISKALGSYLDLDVGTVSAERLNSHYCFRAINKQ